MNRIPKKIHYCWFGKGEKSDLIKRCIKSWKEKLPEYEIIEWNEDNFDVNITKYTADAYKEKKWAFVTDYVRLYVLYNEGGIYLDTDVEIIKRIDCFLVHSAFSGFEDVHLIPTGIMGAEKGNKWIKELLHYYDNVNFYKNNSELNLKPNTVTITELSEPFGLVLNNKYQVLDYDVHIYPKEFFCPKDYATNKILITNNTYCIHHFNGSWLSKSTKIKKFFIQQIIRLVGKENYFKIRELLR